MINMIEQDIYFDTVTIFVIDDDALIRRSLSRLLGTADYQVRSMRRLSCFCRVSRIRALVVLSWMLKCLVWTVWIYMKN